MNLPARLVCALLLLLASLSASAAGFDSRYIARVGDLNGDGLNDISLQYSPKLTLLDLGDGPIPIPISRSVYQTLVLQRSGTGFALVTSLSAAQSTAIATWPIAKLAFQSKDFNGDGDADLAVLNIGMAIAGAPDVVISAPHGSSPAAVLDSLVAQTYYVRAGDINEDQLVDLFITGNSARAVGDFILQQQADHRFSIVNPTAAQRTTASAWATTDIGVFREDLNMDGYFDFILENVDEKIAGAPDLVVFTTRNQGTMPVKVVHVDAAFDQTLEQVEHLLLKPIETLLGLQNQQCYTLNIPILSTNWAPSGGPPWGGFWDDQWRRSYPSVSFVPYSYCTSSFFNFTPAAQNLLGHASQFTSLGLGCTNNCGEATRTTARNAGYSVVISSTALQVARWAFILTSVLVADDATVVGVVDDLLIPATAAVAGGALVVYAGANAVAQGGDTDVGPTANSYTEVTTGDPFKLKPDCDPTDPTKMSSQDLAGTGPGKSARLAKNLTTMGCGKPSGDAEAHHMVRKTAINTASAQSQALLRSLGIDIDEAANGVWLPRGQNALTEARAHLGGGMHSFEYDQAIWLRLKDAALRGGGGGPGAATAVRNELGVIRNELITNTFQF